MAPSALLLSILSTLVGLSVGSGVCRTILDTGCDCGSCPWFTTLAPECKGRTVAYCARQGYFDGGARASHCCQEHPTLWAVVTGVVGFLAVVVVAMGLALRYLYSLRAPDAKAPLLSTPTPHSRPVTPTVTGAESGRRGRAAARAEAPIPGSRI